MTEVIVYLEGSTMAAIARHLAASGVTRVCVAANPRQMNSTLGPDMNVGPPAMISARKIAERFPHARVFHGPRPRNKWR